MIPRKWRLVLYLLDAFLVLMKCSIPAQYRITNLVTASRHGIKYNNNIVLVPSRLYVYLYARAYIAKLRLGK